MTVTGSQFLPLFDSLVAADPSAVAFRIPPLSQGKYAGEYAEFVADYSKLKIAATDRLIAPYIARHTHGPATYTALAGYLARTGAKRFLDLGCGSGELLEELKSVDGSTLVGVTIHTGEVHYARSVRGLPLVVPYDMRFIDDLFAAESFDCIIAYASLQFIPESERETLLGKILNALTPDGIFVEVNYKGDPDTGIPESACRVFRREFSIEPVPVANEVGTVRIFRRTGPLGSNRSALTPSEVATFVGAYRPDHHELELPDDADAYERSISSSFRNESRQSLRRGFTFERHYYLTDQDCADLFAIWRSTDSRQDRPINFDLHLGMTMKWHLDADHPWPIRDYFSLRLWTYFFVVRDPAGTIVAYLELYRDQQAAIVHSTMAHKDHLKHGVNKQLFLHAIRFLIENTSLRRLCYGIKVSPYEPQRVLLRGFRFCR